jgi:hypothetical protein
MPFLSANDVATPTSLTEEASRASAIITRSASEATDGFFDISETLFAGLSVLIGILALVVGLLQLQRYRRQQHLRDKDCVFELEASLPMVREYTRDHRDESPPEFRARQDMRHNTPLPVDEESAIGWR